MLVKKIHQRTKALKCQQPVGFPRFPRFRVMLPDACLTYLLSTSPALGCPCAASTWCSHPIACATHALSPLCWATLIASPSASDASSRCPNLTNGERQTADGKRQINKPQKTQRRIDKRQKDKATNDEGGDSRRQRLSTANRVADCDKPSLAFYPPCSLDQDTPTAANAAHSPRDESTLERSRPKTKTLKQQ